MAKQVVQRDTPAITGNPGVLPVALGQAASLALRARCAREACDTTAFHWVLNARFSLARPPAKAAFCRAVVEHARVRAR